LPPGADSGNITFEMAQRTGAAASPDSGNQFFVALQGGHIVILRPPIAGQPLTAEESASLAGWIMALLEAVPGGHDLFERMLDAIKRT